MNPELQRNLWLEASPFRLAQTAGLLLLVFAATSLAPIGLATSSGVALALYWFFAVLWGTRSAALSVVAEIRERTWDGQKLSAIDPFEMMWGKLFGATAANWFGALLCLLFILAPAWRDEGAGAAITYGVILLALGVFAQALALLSSLVLIRRNTGNWRLDTFLCQVAGIGAAFAYYSLWNSAAAFAQQRHQHPGVVGARLQSQQLPSGVLAAVPGLGAGGLLAGDAGRAALCQRAFRLAGLSGLCRASIAPGFAGRRIPQNILANENRIPSPRPSRFALAALDLAGFDLQHGVPGAQGSGAAALAGRTGARGALACRVPGAGLLDAEHCCRHAVLWDWFWPAALWASGQP